MSRSTFFCATSAGALAAVAVAGQRVGLALTVVLLLVLAVGAHCAQPARERSVLLAIGLGLAAQPVLRDAGWVMAVDVPALVATTGALVVTPHRWPAVARAAVAPLHLPLGFRAVAAHLATRGTVAAGRSWWPVLRGVGLAALGLIAFGLLFTAADTAFADLAHGALDVRLDVGRLLWRAALGLGVLGVAGAVAAVRPPGPWVARAPRAPGVVELRIALTALVALFVVFVVVQLRVLFGGAGYVRETTGLGLGEYARQGFGEMLAVIALTLAVVAVAARRRDAIVRGLLAALCALCLVILVSAHHRLALVIDAYGLTRARVCGGAVLPCLAAVLLLVLIAGARPTVARVAPRIAMTGTLAAVLAFSLSNPDRRIAERAVEQQARTGEVDAAMLGTLSADALPALRRLREPGGRGVVAAVVSRLTRRDGPAGFNLSRARSR
jgi:Domain of unknown function (DUF4173)